MTMAGETPITFVGNAVEDPELRFTPSGAAVAKFRVASTPRTFNKDTSTWVDGEATFLTVNVWRQQAEQVAESILKGMRVVVVGVLKSRTYEKDGQKRTVFEIEAEDIAPSLKFATAKVTKAQKSGTQQQSGGFGGQQSQQRPAAGQSDPWASSQQQGGWGAAPTQSGGGFADEPPF
jgi:single-strand DNA-binding protein